MTDRPYIFKCRKCGIEFPSDTYNRKLCYKCKKSSNPYNSTYYKNRKIAFKRDEFKCRLCKSKKIVIHHLDCDRRNNSLSNLITLCNQCHPFLHDNYTKKQLREGDILKLKPKFILTKFKQRDIDNKKNREYIKKANLQPKIRKLKRFFRINKEGKRIIL